MNKMFLKKLLLLSFLFYVFNTTFSIPPDEFDKLGTFNPDNIDYETKISGISFNLWAGFCELSIRYLRHLKHYSDLHVNYVLFNGFFKKYESGTTLLPDGTKTRKILLHCYARPFVQKNVLPMHVQYFNDIAIILFVNAPDISNKVCIYHRQKNTQEPIYIPIEELRLNYQDLRLVPDLLLSHPNPTTVTSYIFDDNEPTIIENPRFRPVSNTSNFLQMIQLEEFIKLCVGILGQKKFIEDFIVSSDPNDYNQNLNEKQKAGVYVKYSDMDEVLFTNVRTCQGRYIRRGILVHEVKNYKYALASTEFNDKIILCKTIKVLHGSRQYIWPFHAIEMIENLDIEYLKEIL